MNDLLFYALLIALLYYFFFYLPSQKKLNAEPLPLKHNQSTQTETAVKESADTLNCPGIQVVPNPQIIQKLEKDIQQKERTIIGLNNSYEKLETKSKKEIQNLQAQINIITHQLQTLKTHQNKDQKDLSKALDELIKNVQDFSQELN